MSLIHESYKTTSSAYVLPLLRLYRNLDADRCIWNFPER